MKVRQRQLLDERQSRLVIFFRFAGKAGDHIRTNRGISEMFAYEFDASRVVFGAIPAMHGPQNSI